MRTHHDSWLTSPLNFTDHCSVCIVVCRISIAYGMVPVNLGPFSNRTRNSLVVRELPLTVRIPCAATDLVAMPLFFENSVFLSVERPLDLGSAPDLRRR